MYIPARLCLHPCFLLSNVRGTAMVSCLCAAKVICILLVTALIESAVMSCVISTLLRSSSRASSRDGRVSGREVSLHRPKVFQGTKDTPGAKRLGGCLGKRSLRWDSRQCRALVFLLVPSPTCSSPLRALLSYLESCVSHAEKGPAD